MDLRAKRCVACEGGMPRLGSEQIATLLRELSGWEAREEKLCRTFKFPDFRGAMRFVDRMAELAESEGHHPDFCVHYGRVDVTIWTHAIGGLSENDFVLAAKIGDLTETP